MLDATPIDGATARRRPGEASSDPDAAWTRRKDKDKDKDKDKGGATYGCKAHAQVLLAAMAVNLRRAAAFTA